MTTQTQSRLNGQDAETLRKAVVLRARKNQGMYGSSRRAFNKEQVIALRKEYITKDADGRTPTKPQLAIKHGVCVQTIHDALHGTRCYKGY